MTCPGQPPSSLALRRIGRYCRRLLVVALVVVAPGRADSQAADSARWSDVRVGSRIRFVSESLGTILSARSGTVLMKADDSLMVRSANRRDSTTWRVPIDGLREAAVGRTRFSWRSAAFGAVWGALAGPILVFSVCLEAVKCPQGGNGALVVTGVTSVLGFTIGGRRRDWRPVRLPQQPSPGAK